MLTVSRHMRRIGPSCWELRNRLPSAHRRDTQRPQRRPPESCETFWSWPGLTHWNLRAGVLCLPGTLCIIIHHSAAQVPTCRVTHGAGTIQAEGVLHTKKILKSTFFFFFVFFF